MITTFYYTDKALKVGFIFTLVSHHIDHFHSKITVKPNYIELDTETRYNNETLIQMATLYAKLKNQTRFIYQTVYSTKFDKQNEDGQMLDDIQFCKKNS